jgi:hypothetical protein
VNKARKQSSPSNQSRALADGPSPKAGRGLFSALQPLANSADPSHRRPLPKLLVSGSILNVQYEWDNSKRDANLRKHGVDFWDAILALEDPNRLEDISNEMSTARSE